MLAACGPPIFESNTKKFIQSFSEINLNYFLSCVKDPKTPSFCHFLFTKLICHEKLSSDKTKKIF